jgi:hypothetical protein
MAEDYRQARLPRPNLANLDAYHEVGVQLDHEGQELVALDDYHGLYQAALSRRHLVRPMPPDQRLWTSAQVAAVEAAVEGWSVEPDAQGQAEPGALPAAERRNRRAAA